MAPHFTDGPSAAPRTTAENARDPLRSSDYSSTVGYTSFLPPLGGVKKQEALGPSMQSPREEG